MATERELDAVIGGGASGPPAWAESERGRSGAGGPPAGSTTGAAKSRRPRRGDGLTAGPTRRGLLTTAGAAAAAAAAALWGPAATLPPGPARAAAIAAGDYDADLTVAWNHDPASPLGPARWGELGFPGCADGRRQSPVDIRTGNAAAAPGAPLVLEYAPSELAVENTGHVVEVPIPAGVQNTLRLGGERYDLTQYHFHAPSEHAVDGRRADLEAHLVHTNARGDTAVVGVSFRVGPAPNALLDRILRAAPAAAGEEVHAGEANPAELFAHLRGGGAARGGPVLVDAYYAYDGSLTTPGCTEAVRWWVVADGGQVSAAAVARYHELIARFPDYAGYRNNNRPLQPLNGRVVTAVRAGAGGVGFPRTGRPAGAAGAPAPG